MVLAGGVHRGRAALRRMVDRLDGGSTGRQLSGTHARGIAAEPRRCSWGSAPGPVTPSPAIPAALDFDWPWRRRLAYDTAHGTSRPDAGRDVRRRVAASRLSRRRCAALSARRPGGIRGVGRGGDSGQPAAVPRRLRAVRARRRPRVSRSIPKRLSMRVCQPRPPALSAGILGRLRIALPKSARWDARRTVTAQRKRKRRHDSR